MDYVISTGRNKTDKNWEPQYLTWDEFVKRSKKVRKTDETAAQYRQMTAAAKGKIKDGPAFVAGLVRTGRRLRANIDSRSMITLDADSTNDDFPSDVALHLTGVNYLIYPTHSDTPGGTRKYRLVIPLDREVSIDEYGAISRRVAATVGMDNFDRTTFNAGRLMYFPSCSADAEPEFHEGHGVPLSADTILGQYSDWHDCSSWPRHEREQIALRGVQRGVQDPKSKNGAIGLFCRAYSILEAIEGFLEDIYVEGNMSNRYSYILGGSTNGLQVYPETNMAYSHQDSDPVANGRAHNAYDLVRIHKFGHLDREVATISDKVKLPSVAAMNKWVVELPRVKRLSMAEITGEFDEITVDDDEVWQEELVLSDKGAVLATPRNVELILTHDPKLARGLAYDEVKGLEVVVKPIAFRGVGAWQSSDDDLLMHYLGKRYGLTDSKLVRWGLTHVTRLNTIHPIKDYVNGLTWDGVPRAEGLFVRYLGAANTEYTRQVTRKMLLAAMYRAYKPGAKYEQMLVLTGPQECGKSEILKRLGKNKWHMDSLGDLNKLKDVGECLQGGWIFELAELSSYTRSGIEAVKAFLSRDTDRYRPAYGRVVGEYPRRGVFFGTTNDPDFLRDKTGNRRFWPLTVKRVPADIWHSLTDDVIDQVWAEVKVWFDAGEGLEISASAKAEAKEQQKAHMAEDPLIGVIEEWLDTPEVDELGNEIEPQKTRICAARILRECLGYRQRDIGAREARKVREVMRALVDWVEMPKKGKFGKYGPQRGFKRKK